MPSNTGRSSYYLSGPDSRSSYENRTGSSAVNRTCPGHAQPTNDFEQLREHCHCCLQPTFRLESTLAASLSSPVSHLLNSNQNPSLSERTQIRHTLHDVQNTIAKVEATVHSLEAALRQLRSKQEELRAYAHDHQAILSPARRLFPELWSEIFLWCLPEHNLEHRLARRSAGSNITDASSSDAPLLLTRVCSTWREIVLSTPKLWSNITYTVHRPSASKSQLQRLETWLSRSGATPLSVVICRSFFDANNRLDHLHMSIPDLIPPLNNDPVLQFIFAQSHRWQSAEMILPASESPQALAPLKDKLASLKRLTFGIFWNDRVAGGTGGSQADVRVDAFETAPQLQDVALVDQTRLHVSLPSSNVLTTLSVEALMSSLDAISMLLQYPNLQTCELNVMITLSPPNVQSVLLLEEDGQSPVLQMRSLTLTLSGNTVCTYGSFLRYLHLPHLSELRIRSSKLVQGQLIPFLTELPPLRSLELSSPSLSADSLAECLTHPSVHIIERLSVGHGTNFHVPFAPTEPKLASLFRSARFLPRLEEVDWVCFGGNFSAGWDAAQFSGILGARMDGFEFELREDRSPPRRSLSFGLTLNRKWGDLNVSHVGKEFEQLRLRGIGVEIRIGRY